MTVPEPFSDLVTRRRFITTASGLALATTALGFGAPPASALTINPRSSWATNRPPKGPLPAEDVKFLIVHHSASRNGHTSADAPGILRSFYDFHTGAEKGWPDIAYNFLIDSEGGIWEGRFGSLEGPIAGDATGGNQGFTQLVCVIGDYNLIQPSSSSLSSLVILLGWLADRYSVATDPGSTVTFTSKGSNKWPAGSSVTTATITGHRTMSKTTCPGDNLNAYVVGDLMIDVTAARTGLTVTPTTVAPLTTTTQAAPTTSAVPTTTAPPATTSEPSTTTSGPTTSSSSSTTVALSQSAPTSSVVIGIHSRAEVGTTRPAPASSAPDESSPTSTVALAIESSSSQPSILPTVGSLAALALAGGLAWRHRRMSND